MDVSPRLKIEAGSNDGELVLTGEVDVATSGDLDDRLQAAEAGSVVSLDLAGVSFIDSSALRVLLEHHQRFEAAGGRLRLVNVSSPTARLLEIAGLDGHLNLS